MFGGPVLLIACSALGAVLVIAAVVGVVFLVAGVVGALVEVAAELGRPAREGAPDGPVVDSGEAIFVSPREVVPMIA